MNQSVLIHLWLIMERFTGVHNYIALVGKKSSKLDEMLGYYGEALVLKAQELGLNTCWVAMTHGKSYAKIYFELLPDQNVKATCGFGFYTKLDLGIVKYHFEMAAKKKSVCIE